MRMLFVCWLSGCSCLGCSSFTALARFRPWAAALRQAAAPCSSGCCSLLVRLLLPGFLLVRLYSSLGCSSSSSFRAACIWTDTRGRHRHALRPRPRGRHPIGVVLHARPGVRILLPLPPRPPCPVVAAARLVASCWSHTAGPASGRPPPWPGRFPPRARTRPGPAASSGRRPRRGRPVRVVPPPFGGVGVLPPPDRARRAGRRRRPGGVGRPGSLGDHEDDPLVKSAAPVGRGGVTGRCLGPRRALLPRASACHPPLLRSKKSLLILPPRRLPRPPPAAPPAPSGGERLGLNVGYRASNNRSTVSSYSHLFANSGLTLIVHHAILMSCLRVSAILPWNRMTGCT